MSHAAEEVIPAATKFAAKRGFIRTTAQAYAATLSGGIATNVVLGLITGQLDLLVIGVTFGVAVVSPPLAGLASYASIIANGIPGDYKIATRATDSVQPESVQAFKVEAAAKAVVDK